MLLRIRKRKIIRFFIPFLLCMTFACKEMKKEEEKPPYLIRVGESLMTVQEFSRAFEVHKSAYSYDLLSDAGREKKIRLQFLQQMIERLTVFERARELHIAVPDAELDKKTAEIRKNYPKGMFEESLLESAVSFAAWKAELKARMIMEKVIREDITAHIRVSEAEIEEIRKKQETEAARKKAETAKKTSGGKKERKQDKDDKADDKKTEDTAEMKAARIAAFLRRNKTEEAYEGWLRNLGKQYKTEINDAQWKKITGS
ncbi:MAG: SurA N-terminal domain-containing protein [Desulfococcaceae bacterium]|jgi:hypothetical protein|nr:SurA N-terminal domain-containing protein [Desulfococcaceae bacterium]